MSWLISIISLSVLWLILRKWRYAPIAGICGEFIWLAYIIKTRQYGLIPAMIVYTILYTMNIKMWLKEEVK